MDDPSPIDPAIFSDLEREVPVLASIKRYAQGLDHVPWFAGLGTPPTRQVRAAAQGYLDRLGFPDADLAIVADYDDAASVAETHDWASPAWEAEELLRADLTARALAAMSAEALEIGLRLVAQEAAAAARAGAAEQAALWDMADEAALNLAVGSAVQTCHALGLALCVSALEADAEDDETGGDISDHAFTYKFRLFELGRWPVSLLGHTFNVF